MRVGVLEILALPSRRPANHFYNLFFAKQFAGITPQAVSVWCRRQGHTTFYATYYGLGDPYRLLPSDLDVVFISCYTQASPLAYALAKLHRRAGVRTVIGGPHAKAFPADCLRFFDLVVAECDEALVADILRGHFDPGSAISSDRPYDDVPTVEERLPEIRASSLYWGRHSHGLTMIPMLASMGCPYSCNFCIDWNNSYRVLPLDRLAADLRYAGRRLPRMTLMFHDPNFGVQFDRAMEVFEGLPPGQRPPYIIESSLTILRPDRMARLAASNCVYVAPGVESWTDYSNKAGVGRASGLEKVQRVVEHFAQIAEHVQYVQANFIFGLDSDRGPEPVDLTKLFMDQTPYVWPRVNIPVPFGGTPLHADLLAADRVLRVMPFTFYYSPYLVTTLKHYDPVTYYEQLIDLLDHAASPAMLKRRIASTPRRKIKLSHRARTAGLRASVRSHREVLHMLRSDAEFRAFHEGRSAALPEFYHRMYERSLGRYAGLLSRADRVPVLDGPQIARNSR